MLPYPRLILMLSVTNSALPHVHSLLGLHPDGGYEPLRFTFFSGGTW